MREAGAAEPVARGPGPAGREDEPVAVGRAPQLLIRALLVCCASALVLGALGAGVVSLSGGARDDVVPLLTFVGLGQLAAVVAGAGAIVGFGRLARGSGETATVVRGAEVVRSVAGVFRALARGLLAMCVLVAAVWVLAEPGSVAGALTGAVLAGQVAAVLLVAGGRMRGRVDGSVVAR